MATLFMAIAAIAIAALCYGTIPIALRAAGIVAVLLYSGDGLRRLQLCSGWLSWRDSWMWRTANTERALELRSTTLWPGLIVLSFIDAASRRPLTMTLWRDSVAADDARRLRVWLRHFPVFAD